MCTLRRTGLGSRLSIGEFEKSQIRLQAVVVVSCCKLCTDGTTTGYRMTQYFNHRAQLLYTKVGERTDFIRYDRS